MEIYLEIAGNQIDGARDYQEDAFMVTQLGEGEEANQLALVIMADGMGGHAAGNVASNMALSSFNKKFTGAFSIDDVPGALQTGLDAANNAIRETVKETPALSGMGCTMVTAFVARNKIWWVSVGDSHLYLIRDKEIHKKNQDHSYGGYLDRMKEAGVDVEEQPGLARNMLMSAMTGEDIAETDLPTHPFNLEPGDRVIVASDGLDTLSGGAIVQYSEWSDSAKECVEALLKAVEEAAKPRQDNTTVIVIDIKQRDAAPAAVAIEEDEEASETTQPNAVHSGDTVEIEAQAEEEYEDDEEEQEEAGGGKMGLIIGLVAVLAIAAGGGWFFMSGSKIKQPPPEVVTQTEAEPGAGMEAEIDAEAEAEPAAEPEAESEPVTEVAASSADIGKPFRDSLQSGGQGPEMVMLPAGEFTMGGKAGFSNPDQSPRRTLKTGPFAMSRYEITVSDYQVFAKATKRRMRNKDLGNSDTYPMTHVSWDDAYEYAKWLSRETGHTYRLPSEAEWEYAARGGTNMPFWWGFEVGAENAHCFGCKSGLDPRNPTKIGRFEANAYGLYDTAGNVAEWVHDCYHPNYKGAPDDVSVWEGGDCTRRVVRGGSFSGAPTGLNSAARDKFRSTSRYDNVGIRLVREP